MREAEAALSCAIVSIFSETWFGTPGVEAILDDRRNSRARRTVGVVERARRVAPAPRARREPSGGGVGRRALLTLGLELLLRETFFQDARHFLGLHPKFGPDLFGPQSLAVLLHEGDDLIERRGDIVGRTTGESARGRCRAGARRALRGRLFDRSLRPIDYMGLRTAPMRAGEELVKRYRTYGGEDGELGLQRSRHGNAL